jgi:hypothetical protein
LRHEEEGESKRETKGFDEKQHHQRSVGYHLALQPVHGKRPARWLCALNKIISG